MVRPQEQAYSLQQDDDAPKSSDTDTSMLHRVSSLMKNLGIDGTPRNFEMIYEIIAGNNPALKAEFLALGPDKGQQQLDALAKKHLATYHDENFAANTVDAMTGEIGDLLSIIQRESISVRSFNEYISTTAKKLEDGQPLTAERLQSIARYLSKAAAQKLMESKKTVSGFQTHVGRLDKVANSLEQYATQKFKDPVTGLSNLRALNKELIAVYGDNGTRNCTLVLFEIDRFPVITERYGSVIGDKFLKQVGLIIRAATAETDFRSRCNTHRFACVFNRVSPEYAAGSAERIRNKIENSPLVSKSSGRSFGKITVSAGVCASSAARNSAMLLTQTENALARARAFEGNKVCVFEERRVQKFVPKHDRRDWLLYSE